MRKALLLVRPGSEDEAERFRLANRELFDEIIIVKTYWSFQQRLREGCDFIAWIGFAELLEPAKRPERTVEDLREELAMLRAS